MTRILIVEDNPANLRLATFLLEQAGHEVIAAADAAAGIERAQNAQPDLILMDIQLPGMDGLTAARMRKSGPLTRAVRVLALTALAMKGDRERIIAAGCDGYIAKPFNRREFIVKINTLLQGGRTPAEESANGVPGR